MPVLTPIAKPAEPSERAQPIHPLENGDRLTRAEFERRYEAMPDLKKAELIEGEVYVASPARHRRHSKPHSQIHGWLSVYVAGSPGVEAGDNGSIRLDLDNEPQPDAYLMIEPERGGQARISDDDYVEAPPSWSPRSLRAASATTSARNSIPTGATASASTSSGACSTASLIGLCFTKAATNCSPLRPMASCAARFFPAYGSTQPPSFAVISPRSWPWSSRA